MHARKYVIFAIIFRYSFCKEIISKDVCYNLIVHVQGDNSWVGGEGPWSKLYRNLRARSRALFKGSL